MINTQDKLLKFNINDWVYDKDEDQLFYIIEDKWYYMSEDLQDFLISEDLVKTYNESFELVSDEIIKQKVVNKAQELGYVEGTKVQHRGEIYTITQNPEYEFFREDDDFMLVSVEESSNYVIDEQNYIPFFSAWETELHWWNKVN